MMMIVEQPQPLGSAISQTPILSRIHSVTDGMPQTNRRTSSSMMIGKNWFMAAFLLNSNCIHYTKIRLLWQSLFDCIFNQLDLIIRQVEVFVEIFVSPITFIPKLAGSWVYYITHVREKSKWHILIHFHIFI